MTAGEAAEAAEDERAPSGLGAPTGSGAGEDDDEQLASALRIAMMRVARRLRTAQADETLTLSQISALASLDRHGPCSPSALAEIERVQPPSMTRVIAALEERGLAVRAPHETDRRQSVLALSEAGRALLDETRRRRHAWLARCLEELPEADRAVLRAALPVLERLGEC